MKLLSAFLVFACFVVLSITSCADYNLMDEALHPTPVQVKILTTGDSLVSVSWTKYMGDDFKKYKVYVGKSDACDSLVDTLSYRTDTVTTVRKLLPQTHYYFRVLVTTNQGGVGASNIVDTQIAVDSKRELTLYAPDTNLTTDSTVVLRWSHCIDVFDSYKIYMDTATDNVDRKDTVVKTVYGDTSARVNGLKQNRKYRFKVYAMNDTAEVAHSTVVVVTTKQTIQPPWMQNLKISNVLDTAVTLNWPQYRGNDFICYKVCYSDSGNVNLKNIVADSIGIFTDTAKVIHSLAVNKHYYFRVFVIIKTPDTLYTDEADTTTLDKRKLTFCPIQYTTDSSVVLTWSKYLMNRGSYKLYKNDSVTVDNTRGLFQINNFNDTSALVNGLKPKTSYWFQVWAWQDTGFVAHSDPLEVFIKGN